MIAKTKNNHQLMALRRLQMVKSKEPIYRLLQIYLNNLVDKKVNLAYETNLDEYNGYGSFSQQAIYSTIFNLNHPDTVRSFQRIVNSSYTSNDAVFKNLTRISADKVTRIISEVETERVLKNLEYVEKTLQTGKFDIDKYNQLAKNISSSRYDILEKALEEGKMFTGRELSYKELDRLAENLERYKQHRVDYEEAKAINEEARANGLPDVYTHKKWIWSQLENTRHAGMDGEIVELEETFTVHNEVNGDIDSLLFPGDVENYHNPSNIINCQCDYEILGNDHSNYEKINNELSKNEINKIDNTYNKEYPENVKSSMYDYSVDSNIVNDCLRNHKGIWNSELEKKYGMNSIHFNNMVRNLDNNQVKLVKDTTLHRGLNKPVNEFKIGQDFPDKGYASSSFDRGVAKYFAGENGTIFHIDAPKGTKGNYIRQHSKYPQQVEFLLPRNTNLVIYDIQRNNIYCMLKYL